MHLITQILPSTKGCRSVVLIVVDRHKLARRRWRGIAADGTEFGIDVAEAIRHGDCVYQTESTHYIVEQEPEECLLILLSEVCNAAWIGWMIGNLHFKASFSEEGLLVQDDLAVIQMLDREQIAYKQVTRVFQPAKQGGHSHNHTHSQSH